MKTLLALVALVTLCGCASHSSPVKPTEVERSFVREQIRELNSDLFKKKEATTQAVSPECR